MTQPMDREPDASRTGQKFPTVTIPARGRIEWDGQRFGSALTPEERWWWLNVWWPAARTQLRRAAEIEP